MIRVSKSEKWNQGFRLVQLKGNHFIFGISYDFTRFLTEFGQNELKNPDIFDLVKTHNLAIFDKNELSIGKIGMIQGTSLQNDSWIFAIGTV